MILQLRFQQTGQTLLEVLVALGTGVVVLVAITLVVLASLANTQFSKNQSLATLYAQQGMEIVRDLKNRSWSSFYAKTPADGIGSTKYCIPSTGIINTTSGACSGEKIDSFFTREAVFVCFDDVPSATDCSDTNKTDDKVRITVTVSFTDNKGEHKSELISVFTNWQ